MIRKVLAMLLTVTAVLSCFACAPSGPVRLDPETITQYQGTDLTPADSLPENSIQGVQEIALEDYRLAIGGEVASPFTVTYDEILENTRYEKLVILHCVEGWDATILWEGILIRELLAPAAIKESAVTVIFHASDGYTTSLPLSTIREKDILLAYKANGATLPARLGFPFIVVAEERLGYKWARWVVEIELSADPNYRGYWEQRGYSNEAEVSNP